MYDADKTKELAPQIEAIIEQGIAAGCPVSKELKGLTQYLVKRSQWILSVVTVLLTISVTVVSTM